MNAPSKSQSMLQSLEELLENADLPPAAAEQGRRILEKARAPVRIAVTGPAGGGKSQLINLLAGRALLPPGRPCPPLDLRWGKVERTQIVLPDGGTHQVDGIMPNSAETRPAARLVLEAPIEVLKRFDLSEAALQDPMDGPQEELEEILNNADIVLWCAQEFSRKAQSFWARVPDSKKDHAFFILTKADILAQAGNLSDHIETLQDQVAEEFHSLIPVATLQAVAAIADGERVDQPALAASGGKALRETILHHVETGRRADLDGVLVFLSQHGVNTPSQTRRPARLPDPQPATLPDSSSRIQPALAYLRERADDLLHLSREDDDRTGKILAHCVTTAESLSKLLDEDLAPGPSSRQLHDDVLDANDAIILMQMEDGEGAAADAVTVLMQLRRDMEALIAA